MSEIKVTITDNGTQSTTSKTIQQRANTTKEATEKLDPKNEASTQTKKDSQVMVVAGMVASRSFNYITSNVGKWTGNSRNQETGAYLQDDFVTMVYQKLLERNKTLRK